MMELLMLFAFSIVVAILFNFGAPRFAATGIGQRFVGSYAMTTLGTAFVIFAAIYLSSIALSAVKAQPGLPTTSNPT
jgi:hypothetical protein